MSKTSTTISKKKKKIPRPTVRDMVADLKTPPPDPKTERENFKRQAGKFGKKYPPPLSKGPLFNLKWSVFIEDVAQRENFKPGHLSQLEILCDLYVELKKMQAIIAKEGYTYESETRNGLQIKPRPEVTQQNRILSEIRSYSKILGLLLVKDSAFEDPHEGDEEWN